MVRLLTLLLLAIMSQHAAASGNYINYQVDKQVFEGYFISPSTNAPLILLIHDWDGLTDYEVKRAHMMAEQGYAVFAADLFGAGVRPTELADKRRLTGELYNDRERMRRLLKAAMELAQQQQKNAPHSVAAGYCFGGAAVLELARSGAEMDGFVTFHGGLTTPAGQDYSATRGKLLIMHGSADTVVTMQDFAALASELEKTGVQHEMITYSGAPHAFTIFSSERYREDADSKSWKRFTEFLQEIRGTTR